MRQIARNTIREAFPTFDAAWVRALKNTVSTRYVSPFARVPQ